MSEAPVDPTMVPGNPATPPADTTAQAAPTQSQSQGGDKMAEVKSQLQTWGEELKQELSGRIDQKLDELSARIQ